MLLDKIKRRKESITMIITGGTDAVETFLIFFPGGKFIILQVKCSLIFFPKFNLD